VTRGPAASSAEPLANARTDARRTLALALAVTLLTLVSLPLDAQQLSTAGGRVVIPRATDTVPLPHARLVLHRVGRDAQGPVDSMVADRSGGFRFRFKADTSAIYLLSSRYDGIEYFSPPVHTNPARPDTAITLQVYDTSSTTPIAVEARHIVVPRPGADGSRPVLDLIVLRNDGLRARIAPDSAHPSWSLTLPPGSGEMQVGEGDVSPDAVARVGDTVRVLAPLAPGQKQLSIAYATVAVDGKLIFPIGPAETPLNLLVEEPGARVSGGALALADTQVIEGRTFRRYSGRVPAGRSVTLTVPVGPAAAARRILIGLVAGLALALGAAAVWLVRRPRRSVSRAAAGQPDEAGRLLDAIAVLDARYTGRAAEVPPDEWQRYADERATLKARLEHALAAASPAP
jgi:hypothetical protein